MLVLFLGSELFGRPWQYRRRRNIILVTKYRGGSELQSFRRTLASPPKWVLVPRAAKRPAPGTAAPTLTTADRTSGAVLDSRVVWRAQERRLRK